MTRLETWPDVADHERHVEIAVGEPLEQLEVVIGLEQTHLGAGELVAQAPDHERQHRRRRALERADRDLTDLAGAEAVDPLAGGVDPRQQVAGGVEHLGARAA